MPEADDLRTFIRDIMRRFERQQDAVIAELEAQREEFVAQRRDLDDMRGEVRAQTQAVLRLLDRFDGGTAAA